MNSFPPALALPPPRTLPSSTRADRAKELAGLERNVRPGSIRGGPGQVDTDNNQAVLLHGPRTRIQTERPFPPSEPPGRELLPGFADGVEEKLRDDVADSEGRLRGGGTGREKR